MTAQRVPPAPWPGGAPRALLLLLVLLAFLPAACAERRSDDRPRAFGFEEKPPLRFDVAEIEIQASEPGSGEPAAAARRWAATRLAAAGDEGRLRFLVSESFLEERRQEPDSRRANPLAEAALRSEARLRVEVLVLGTGDFVAARVAVQGEQAAILPLDRSDEERRSLQDELVRDLMADVDRRLEAALRRRLAKYLLAP